MASGVETTGVPVGAMLDDILGNRFGSTTRVPFDLIAAAIWQKLGGVAYATYAELQADLSPADGTLASVWGDTDAINGIYRKDGVADEGNWARIGDLPTNAVQAAEILAAKNRANHTGTQSADTITDSVEKVMMTVVERTVLSWLEENNPFALGLHSPKNTAGDTSESGQFTDGLGRVIGEIWPDLSWRFGDVHAIVDALLKDRIVHDRLGRQLFGLTEQGGILLGGLEIASEMEAKSLAFMDAERNMLDLVELHKRVRSLEASVVRKVGKFVQPPADLVATTLRMIISYGQSLSIGARGQPALTTAQAYRNLMFTQGLRGEVADLSGLVPLIEADYGDNGETLMSGLTDHLSALDPGYAAGSYAYVGTVPGKAGREIFNLSKGSTNYAALPTQMAALKGLAEAAGETASLWFWGFTQGEQDTAVETNPALYESRLRQMVASMAFDAKASFGQSFAPKCLIYQTAANRVYGVDPHIALAQLKVAQEDGLLMACPIYMFDFYTDSLHLTNDSYRMLGLYYGRAADSFARQGFWAPLHPVTTIAQGRTITQQYHVPTGSLQFDTTRVTEAVNYGFDIRDADGALRDIIDTVDITGVDTIRVTLTGDLQEGDRLTYAWGRDGDPATSGRIDGPRGNLCDEAGTGDTYTTSGAVVVPLHNYSVISDEEIQQWA
ncbi:hypothetical protein ABEB22_18265 (plasmid) [Thioclava sp. 'Guangxiensis']|uniref:hypothetical protein n=1 Tax=Thioclava sp. 'Guangxiensis' TaxID=3149044 RepID=UPI00387842E5